MDAKELEIPQPGEKRKPLPMVMACGPEEYLPGQQEDPVLLYAPALDLPRPRGDHGALRGAGRQSL